MPSPDTTDLSDSESSGLAQKADNLGEFLRQETAGGKLLLAATAVALIWANVHAASYDDFWGTATSLGPGWLHLDLTLGAWAADGLLAIFFFVAGLELKRELVTGELSDRRAAMLPVFAAVGGMIAPALIVLAVSGGDAAQGGAWAIPVATDIAFALGVLALVGAALPSGVRVLLLSIAVIDDLLAITLIAILFTADISVGWIAVSAVLATAYCASFRLGIDRAWLLWALALCVWIAVHASGVHATVAGVILALLTPVRPRTGEADPVGERLEHRLHPISAGIAVPVFALAATGIPLAAAGDAVSDSISIGIFAGLLLGKFAGVFGGARLAVALRLGSLPDRVHWPDVVPIAVLSGIGYTVSLLISELAFDSVDAQDRAAAAILVASVVASALSVFLLRRRSR